MRTLRQGLPWLLALLCCPSIVPARANETPPATERGTVVFEPPDSQENVPERYRLSALKFAYELKWMRDLPASGVTIYHLTFPSPVKSSCAENNVVHAEYYRPQVKGPFPCAIVLDIMAGDGRVARLCASTLAQNGIGALFVTMPYYGQRRPAGSKLRMLSIDLKRSLEAVRQSVLDLRCATAWMASRPEVDARRLGIMGTSLGSLVAALTAEMEPRLGRVAILLGGGGLVDAYYDDPRARPYRQVWEAAGGTKAEVAKILAPVDPLTCAANLKQRKVLMIAAKNDEIILPKMADALWQAAGKQQIYWIDATHYSAVLYVAPGLQKVVRHFQATDHRSEIEGIRKVLDDQVAAWNARDLPRFMKGYWESDQLSFYSGNSKTHGWKATLERYQKKYQGEGKEMGRLSFEELSFELLGADHALVRGRFRLELTGKTATGIFTLVFRKTAVGWRIIHDHTSS